MTVWPASAHNFAIVEPIMPAPMIPMRMACTPDTHYITTGGQNNVMYEWRRHSHCNRKN
jgi:hypothetical protein